MAAGCGAFDLGGAQPLAGQLLAGGEVALQLLLWNAVVLGFFGPHLLVSFLLGGFLLLRLLLLVVARDHDFGALVVGRGHHHHVAATVARCLAFGGFEHRLLEWFAGHLGIEPLLAGDHDVLNHGFACFGLVAVELLAQSLGLVSRLGRLGQRFFALGSGQLVSLLFKVLGLGPGCGKVLLKLAGLVHGLLKLLRGCFQAGEHFLGFQRVHGVRDLLGLGHALVHGFTGFHVDHVRVGIDQGDKRIPHLLWRHAAQDGARKMIDHAGGHFFAGDLALIGGRVVEHAKVGLHVVVQVLHQPFEVLLKVRIHGHRVVHEFIQRFDQSEAESLLPQTVHDDGSEPRILLVGHPACVGLEGRFAGQDVALMPHHRAGLYLRVRLGIVILVIVGEGGQAFLVEAHRGVAVGIPDLLGGVAQAALLVLHLLLHLVALLLQDGKVLLVLRLQRGKRLRSHVLGALGVVRPLELIHLGLFLVAHQFAHPAECAAFIVLGLNAEGEGRHLVELHLRPLVERMVVALGALDASAEEHANRVGHVVQRHAAIAHVVANCAIVPGLALGRDHVPHESVVGLVVAQALLDEIGVGGAGDLAGLLSLGLRPQDVGPIVEEVLHVAFGSQQLVDQFGALVLVLGGGELLHLAGGGNAAHHIKVDAAHENAVIGGSVGSQFAGGPVLGQNRVNGMGRGRHVRLGRSGKTQAGGQQKSGGENALHASKNAIQAHNVTKLAQSDLTTL